jgi:hypothetical protein
LREESSSAREDPADGAAASQIKRSAQTIDDASLMIGGEFGVDWQRENFFGGQFGFGQIAFGVAEIFETFLQVQWDGIVDSRSRSAVL